MVEKDTRQINMMEVEGCCELLKYIEPGYCIYSRATISRCVEEHCKEKKDELKAAQTGSQLKLTDY